jgi:2-polyprenyl-6-methoxyphenol hydroxylase-like FAD-dependent oxidoreductase
MSEPTQVLIAGAGPTGLVLALWLARVGVRLRVVDKAAEPGTTSRAIAVQARTLEFYRQLGLADAVVEQGLKFAAVNLWTAGRKRGRVALGDMGQGISPFPYVLAFPQDQHERLLIERLSEVGVDVERRTELLHFERAGRGVRARLRRPDGTEETCEADYIAGCDGAHSKARDVLGTGFPGGTYDRLFYVADANLSGTVADQELHLALDDDDFLAVFPLRGDGYARLIGTVMQASEQRRHDLTWNDISPRIFERLTITVDRVNWFSTYRVSHRVADHFRSGRAFLLGDAAHIHSPVGGQGMNTGIGDAVNLAWKLAAVLRGDASSEILDTYEPERIAFAQRLVATTDRIFALVTSRGPIAGRVREGVVPRVLPALFNAESFRKYMFGTVSQVLVNYRGTRLSEGRAGRVQGGDRLPWVRLGGNSGLDDDFAPLTALDWQVHVHGEPTSNTVEVCRRRRLPLHAFAWHAESGEAGLMRDALYLVRPDGYVALAEPGARSSRLSQYLDRFELRMRGGSA